MPEGPSLVIAKEELRPLVGLTVNNAEGNAKTVDFERLRHTTLKSVRTWGKHLLLKFGTVTLRIHFLMFGRYAVNEPKPNRLPKLAIKFRGGSSLFFYACAIQTIEGSISSVYDWSSDVMNNKWDPDKAMTKLKAIGDDYICDALLDQSIFAGVGNIIKNEVLFRCRVHPFSTINKIPRKKLRELVHDTSTYSFLFLKWKRAMQLKKHWEAYTKKICPRDGHPIKKSYAGATRRRTFYCEHCQKLYA